MHERRRVTLRAPWTPTWLRRVTTAIGAVYLLAIWLDGVGVRRANRVLPLPLHLFVQVAELFPNASPDSIEWRARVWSCALERFDEIDVRPFFPIRRDDKESRFDRAMFFYHRHPAVLKALDLYITSAENRLHPEARVGGLMLLSLEVPIPPLGAPGPRHERLPITSYSPSVGRRYWYTTGIEERRQRCSEAP